MRTVERRIFWIYGKSGVGKTTWFSRNYPGRSFAIVNADFADFFNGYDPEIHDALILNELDPSTWPLALKELKFRRFTNIVEREHNTTINVKGSFVKLKCDILVITSPYSPFGAFYYYFKGKSESQIINNWTEVARRLTTVIHLTKQRRES